MPDSDYKLEVHQVARGSATNVNNLLEIVETEQRGYELALYTLTNLSEMSERLYFFFAWPQRGPSSQELEGLRMLCSSPDGDGDLKKSVEAIFDGFFVGSDGAAVVALRHRCAEGGDLLGGVVTKNAECKINMKGGPEWRSEGRKCSYLGFFRPADKISLPTAGIEITIL